MAIKSAVNKMFTKYLFLTNATSLGVLLGCGDMIEQGVVERFRSHEKPPEVDFNRTGRMVASTLIVSPWLHNFYKVLDKRYPGHAVRTVVVKSAWDLLLQAPVSCFLWIQSLGFMEGNGVKKNSENFVIKFPALLAGEVLFWVPAQAVNFYLLPPKYRVVYVAVVSLVYSTFLSFVVNEYGEDEEKHKIKELEPSR